MKTIFTSHGNDSCSIKYQDRLTDLIENRTFAKKGHYVFEIGFDGYERQLCKNLELSGVTLLCDPKIDLIDIIRKEYKSFKYQQLKYLNA
jgi:DNA polymerase III epsilon subunit-like protein